MTLAKICGLTNLADAQAAAAAGADFLGFIFYPPSPRSIDLAAATTIARALRAVPGCPTLVGVFVNETARAMAAVLDQAGLDLAQLSGDETPNIIGDPGSPLFGRSYKALRPASLAEAEAEAEWFLPPEVAQRQPALLIDAYHPALHGGTGLLTDWSLAAEMARQVPQLMLAGGLTPDNVAAAVAAVNPFAVDVASGVESTPGRKDHAAVRAFIAAAHGSA